MIAVNNSGTMVKHMGTIVGNSEKLKPGQPGFMVNIFENFIELTILYLFTTNIIIYIVPIST